MPLVPVGSTRCRAWTRRSSTRAHPKSRFACAPRRRARRGKEYYPLQRRVCALATITRAGARRERSCALRACAEVRSAYAFASAVATSVGYHSCQSTVEGGTDPVGTCSRSRGGGTINRGGTLNRTKMVTTPNPHRSRVYMYVLHSCALPRAANHNPKNCNPTRTHRGGASFSQRPPAARPGRYRVYCITRLSSDVRATASRVGVRGG